MQKEDLFNYVMNTPGNTNPAVLKSIIEAVYAESGSSEVRATYDIPEVEGVSITVTNQKLLYSPGEFCKIRIRNRSGVTITARITISASTDDPEIYNTSEIQTSLENNSFVYEYSYFTPNTNFSVSVRV
jgi:hypothetical protein